MEAISPVIPEPTKKQVRNYFVHTGLQFKNSLKMHKAAGLWDKEIDESGVLKRTNEGRLSDWANVSEHCLVEVARVGVLSEYLGLPRDLREDLKVAAALHDFSKRKNAKLLAQKAVQWQAMRKHHNSQQKPYKKLDSVNGLYD